MCERCREDTVWGERIEVDDVVDCEWLDAESLEEEVAEDEDLDALDLLEDGCGKPATCRIFSRYAEEHLCTDHMEEDNEELETGLGDFLRESGLLVASDYLPIHEPTRCDRCERSASHAKMVVDEHYLCLKHAREMGWDPDSVSPGE